MEFLEYEGLEPPSLRPTVISIPSDSDGNILRYKEVEVSAYLYSPLML
jgi:hypothetical protein